MEDPLQKRLEFHDQVVPRRGCLTRQPDQEKETQNGANKSSSPYVSYFKPRIVKTERNLSKGNQSPYDGLTSTEKTHTPNENPTEVLHISKGRFRKYGSVTGEIESLHDARMRIAAEIQNSIIFGSNGPCDAQADKIATPSVLESNARNMEGLIPRIFPDEGKKRKIEVITIDSDEEEDNSVSNDKSLPVTSPSCYGKLVAEKLLKLLKDKDLLKSSNYGPNMNNKEKEVAPGVSSMSTPHEDKTHNSNSNSYTKDEDVAGKNNQNSAEVVDMAEDESLNNSSAIEKSCSIDADGSPVDDLEECWLDMDLAMETAKENESLEEPTAHIKRKDPCNEDDDEDVCVHDCRLDEQHGLVCRICGLIEKKIDTIFEYQLPKPSRSMKTYPVGPRGQTDLNISDRPAKVLDAFDGEITGSNVSIHSRHLKHIRPHQLEGFNFLVKNLTGENPGGCILAHAPGSGKTFMLISFIQSFLGKYPNLRPLIVLPKGIVPTWRKEFENWQIEQIPLYDFYRDKTDNRSQQLEILKKWERNKSVLLLGYQQFANIVTDETNVTARECRDKLLKVPGLLILDEGHTPRNEDTNILNSLAQVQTVRKVILSGTLFQNHVKEVFNIVNLIRPRFLMSEHARPIVRRILSQVDMAGRRNTSSFSEALFCDLVEETLKKEENSSAKIEVIKGLRKVTENILHYYKGDLLDDLPGLCDFTVILNLTPRQKQIVKTICRFNNIFKRNSSCALVTVHPSLEEKKDNEIDISEGVKAKFIINLISLAVSHKEKVLVFGMYMRSLKFLEKLVINRTGWAMNKEVFQITGKTSPAARERATEMFNNSKDAKILFGSVKACGEGISLVGASRLVILDQHANPSVTRQVVGRAFRPGQVKKVFCYRLVSHQSPEEEEHATSLRKEVVSKMWFEWKENEMKRYKFGLEAVDFKNCEDIFFESAVLREDVNALYKRAKYIKRDRT